MRRSQAQAFAVVALLVLSSSFANAARTTCKGMIEDACSTSNACTWISGYERRDGVKINGYCRNKPRKSSAKQNLSDAKQRADVTRIVSEKGRS